MSVTGKIKNGVVVLPPGTEFPEGAEVKVETVEPASAAQSQPPPSTLGRRLRVFSGAAKRLPPDMARNHDHYLHGRPKK